MEADVLAGTDLTKTASGGQVTINHSVTGASSVNNSNGVVLQDLTINGRGHVTGTGSVDLDGRYYRETELDAGQLDNRYYTEAETGTLIDNKIDTALNNDVLAGQSITKNASGGQVTISIANGAIGANQIAADAVGASELADNAVASANIIDGSIVNADINASADIAGSKLADDSVTLAKLGSGALPTDITIASANIVNGTIVDADIATGTLDNRYFTETELTGGALDGRYYTETESDARYFNISTGDTIKDGDTFPDNDTTIATTAAINDRIIDLVDDVGGFVPIANETSFPNANPDVNNGAGTLVSIKALSSNLTSNGSGVATISNGTVGNSTVTINGLANSTTYAATFGMIVETTTTLNTYTFHRLVPKATEVTTVAGSISNVNTVAGDISNVNAVAGNATNINAVAGNSSNINSAVSNASNINSAVSNASNINSAVSNASNINTVAGSISNVNSVGGSISNVNTVATNISNVNDFSDKYRVASSAPSSNNDTGDLYFDTSANELKVYNGSAWQGGVTATGNLAGLGANTFTGNQSLGDNNKVIFGAGNDLQIYHDGSHSYIEDAGTGAIKIKGDDVRIEDSAANNIIKSTGSSAELFYDGVKKFNTKSDGVLITGEASVTNHLMMNHADNQKIYLGAGDDLQIYHNGTDSWIYNSTGELNIRQSAGGDINLQPYGGEDGIVVKPNGAVELYYDNSKKFETITSGVRISGDLELLDNTGSTGRLLLGNGADLRLYHDGSHSYIQDVGTGNLILAGTQVNILNAAANESMIRAAENGSVQLYYDNSKKFETTSYGTLFTGNSKWVDNGKATFGDGDDLQIFHNGSTSYIKDNGTGALVINSVDGNILLRVNDTEESVKCIENGAVELYYDGSKKLHTIAGGIYVTGNVYSNNTGTTAAFSCTDNGRSAWGSSNDLQIYHDGNNSYLTNSTGTLFIKNTSGSDLDVFSNGSTRLRVNAGEMAVDCSHNSSVDLYYDNSKKFETTSDGCTVTGYLNNNHLRNTVSGDQYVGNSTQGGLYLYVQDNTNNSIILQANTGEKYLEAKMGSSVDLYHHGSKKLETTSTGVSVTGNVNPAANNTHDLGTSSLRWNNLYVNDMHFSNHPENPNSVDGTWGDWTLQEGENDIYMLNNRTGKKYKMALTEVS